MKGFTTLKNKGFVTSLKSTGECWVTGQPIYEISGSRSGTTAGGTVLDASITSDDYVLIPTKGYYEYDYTGYTGTLQNPTPISGHVISAIGGSAIEITSSGMIASTGGSGTVITEYTNLAYRVYMYKKFTS